MATVWLVLYVLAIVVFFTVAVRWARKKSRDFKKNRQPSANEEFFFKALPPGWYLPYVFVLSALAAAYVLSLLV